MRGHRLAVWGDPIAHSKSPALHTAAYRALDVPWEYDLRRVPAEGFTAALSGLDRSWRGLSLTMPLKEQAFLAAGTRDPHAELTGAVNTLLLGDDVAGFNTDVGGIIDALAENAITEVRSARILGAGATAASALAALAELGASRIDLRARRPERAAGLAALGERLGCITTVSPMTDPVDGADVTIATLPSGTVLDAPVAEAFAGDGGALLDAAYAPWPSALGLAWENGPVISGIRMLLHQAVRQVRIFHHGDPLEALPDEGRVLAAMEAAI
ncbi:shikimate dehydrogenase [Microbacterium paludicola]|uniref:shikimate dehydrogenase n=1 Tax=Microbacterium paludicola TaxID=300019 RepID=UPI0011A1A396|nr:shikimate dehydrogenase [Microbacterium paludicola]